MLLPHTPGVSVLGIDKKFLTFRLAHVARVCLQALWFLKFLTKRASGPPRAALRLDSRAALRLESRC